MKLLVVSYSRGGNNRYLAGKIAESLGCDHEVLRPKLSWFPWLLLTSGLGWGVGAGRLTHQPGDYDAVILCGPIWMGTLISPLRGFVRRHRKHLPAVFFATCCGGGDASKDGPYGYESVFGKLRAMVPQQFAGAMAFPVDFVLPPGTDPKAVMEVRLNDDNFRGEIQQRLDSWLPTVSGWRSA